MDFLRKQKYRLVSAGAATLEGVAVPTAKNTHRTIEKGVNNINRSVNSFFDELDRGTCNKISGLFGGLKFVFAKLGSAIKNYA